MNLIVIESKIFNYSCLTFICCGNGSIIYNLKPMYRFKLAVNLIIRRESKLLEFFLANILNKMSKHMLRNNGSESRLGEHLAEQGWNASCNDKL